MASGIGVNPTCLDEYAKLKSKKEYKYIIFKVSDDNKEIVVEKTSKSSNYEDFLADLPEADCRWAVYDFEFEKGDAGVRQKIVFISWSPDDAKIKKKMVFASSKDSLRKAFQGLAVEIQGTDYSEVSHDAVLEKASRGN